MPEYQLQIKQVVDYPRCRIYREFIHKLINDRSIRINGGSGLFHFTVLCSYANFRKNLEVGQSVVTAGGIYGKIKEIEDNTVVVEVAAENLPHQILLQGKGADG